MKIVSMLNRTEIGAQGKVPESGNGFFGSLMNRLMEDRTGDEINLSDIHHHIKALNLPGDKTVLEGKTLLGEERRISNILDPSTALDLEAMLRNFQLPTGDVEQIIGAARVAGGGIDLNIFIAELRKRIPNQDPIVIGSTLPYTIPSLHPSESSRQSGSLKSALKDIGIAESILEQISGGAGRNVPNLDPDDLILRLHGSETSSTGMIQQQAGKISIKDFVAALDQLSLESKDVPLLKDFLYECGYSRTDVDSLMSRLTNDRTGNRISLSNVFHHIEALNLPGEKALVEGKTLLNKKTGMPIILDPSTALDLEMMLRNFDLPTGDIEQIIGTARVAGGGIDLNLFVAELNKRMPNQDPIMDGSALPFTEPLIHPSEFSRQSGSSGSLLKDTGLAESILELISGGTGQNVPNRDPDDPIFRRNDIGKRISDIIRKFGDESSNRQALNDPKTTTTEMVQPQQAGKMSIKDFIVTLEHIAGNQTKKASSVPGTKATVDQILDKVIVQGEKRQPAMEMQALSKSGRADPWLDSRVGGKTRMLSGAEPPGPFSVKPSNGNNPGVETNRTSSLQDTGVKSGTPQFDLSRSLNHPDGGRAPEKGTKPVPPQLHGNARSIDMAPETSRSPMSESLNPTAHQDRSERPLPGYLIDQVGRQISRSIIRGQKGLKLQLKPPEMGTLKIEIDIQNNGLKLGMIAENSSVRQLLLANLPQLKEALGEQGIKLDRLDVQINNGFDPSMANSKDGSNGSLDKRQNGFENMGKHPNTGGSTDDVMAHSANDGLSATMGHRLLDLVA